MAPAMVGETLRVSAVASGLRASGISTNSLEVLKRFNADGSCKVVQVDYSLVNLQPEEEFLPYCEKQAIAVMVRGPLARGLLSGRYTSESVFADSIRETYNPGGDERATFEKRMARVEKLRASVPDGEEMATTALRFVISHTS